jgi:hypothetical protein
VEGRREQDGMMQELGDTATGRQLWDHIQPTLAASPGKSTPSTPTRESLIAEARLLAKVLKVRADEEWASIDVELASTKGIPELINCNEAIHYGTMASDADDALRKLESVCEADFVLPAVPGPEASAEVNLRFLIDHQTAANSRYVDSQDVDDEAKKLILWDKVEVVRERLPALWAKVTGVGFINRDRGPMLFRGSAEARPLVASHNPPAPAVNAPGATTDGTVEAASASPKNLGGQRGPGPTGTAAATAAAATTGTGGVGKWECRCGTLNPYSVSVNKDDRVCSSCNYGPPSRSAVFEPRDGGQKACRVFMAWVPSFNIRKQYLVAKRVFKKTYEIRKVDANELRMGMLSRTVGDFHYYLCRGGRGRSSKSEYSLWQLSSEPVFHKTIYDAVVEVGFKTLLPLTASADECVIELVGMYGASKDEMPKTLAEARACDAKFAQKEIMFMTFQDVEVPIDTVHSILAFRPHLTIE